MEFGVVGQDGLVGLGNEFFSPPSDNNNGDWKPTKVAKLSDDLSLNTNNSSNSPLKHYSSSFGYCDEHNMLSFSSPKLENKYLQSSTFPFHQHPNLCYSKSSGYGIVNPSMHLLSGVRGPFTTSQWYELEQQALIYKYIIANEPIPSNLLLPIRRAFESAGFCNFLGGLLRPNTIGYGWGPFHLGFNTTTDPEPGRCRRTDGKKWRCSREAVHDQKYCERHMNRGRHRSRKPVEGHSSHSISKPTTSNKTTPLVLSGGGPSTNSFARNIHPNKDLFLHSKHLSSSLLNGLMVNKDDNSHGKQETSRLEVFPPSSGHTISQNTTTSRSCSLTFGSYGQSHSFTHDQSSIIDPKTHTQTNRSLLYVSIPPSNSMSSSISSPTRDGDALSPLRLSRVLAGSVETSLGVGPTSWETSMGGPLGEVLKSSTSNKSLGNFQLTSS